MDPRGHPLLLDRRSAAVGARPSPGTDFHAVVNRRIAVTPIHLDLTGRRLLRQLQDWDWDLEGATAKAAEHADPGAGGDGGAPAVEEARIAEEAELDRR